MPDDPYQIGDTDSGITLVLSDRGVGVAAAHAIEHVTGGNDKIRDATTTQDGLMTAAHALKLDGITAGAQPTNATLIASALGGVSTETTLASDDVFSFLDTSAAGALKRITTTNLITYLGGSLVKTSGDQSITGTKTFSSVVLTSATINGGAINNCTIPFSTNTFTGQLPVANGGTGLASYSVGSLLYASGSTTLSGLAAAATGNVLLSGSTPSWGKVGLTTHVDGVLPVTRGGTGVNTLTAGVVKCNGTSNFSSGTVSLTSEVSGVLPVGNGGTGFSTNPYGQLGGQTEGPEFSDNDYTKLVIDTDLDTSNSSEFDNGGSGNNNRLRYTGLTTRRFLVYASVDIKSAVSGANYSIKLYKNSTTALDYTQCNANAAGKNPNYLAKLVTNWIVELSQNDYIELFASATEEDVGRPQRMRLIATPI